MHDTSCMLERERKYLVARHPDLTGVPPVHIRQGYFTEDEGEAADPLRLRAAKGKFELTKKLMVIPGEYGVAEEITLPISEQEFAVLWPHVLHKLEKNRYLIPLDNNLVAELDVYLGKLEGFVQVEVEFPDEAAEQTFIPPDWFGRHITGEQWAWNLYYATVDWPTLQKTIARSGY